MGPDPTRAYFWPAVNKRPTWVLSNPTRSNFFLPEGGKLKNLTFLGEIFQILTQTINRWPDPSKKKITRPGSKNFDPNPSLIITVCSRVQFSVTNLIRHAQNSLSEIYDDYTVAEWIEQKIYPVNLLLKIVSLKVRL